MFCMEYNYQATKESIERAGSGEPKAKDVVSQKDSAEHPFAAKWDSSDMKSSSSTGSGGWLSRLLSIFKS